MDNKMKRQKSKNKNQINQQGSKLKKKSLKRSPQNQQLKNQIVKYFSMLQRQSINTKQLKFLLMNLGYNPFQCNQLIKKANQLSTSQSPQIYFYPQQVYAICDQYAPKKNWKKQTFQLFSSDKKQIKLQDLQAIYYNLKKINKKQIMHPQNLKCISNYYGGSDFGINLESFTKLLLDSNCFTL